MKNIELKCIRLISHIFLSFDLKFNFLNNLSRCGHCNEIRKKKHKYYGIFQLCKQLKNKMQYKCKEGNNKHRKKCLITKKTRARERKEKYINKLNVCADCTKKWYFV